MPDHHPPHYCINDTWYFISASTYQHQRFLQSPYAKQFLRDQLGGLIKTYNIKLAAWVILDNHYHMLVMIQDSFRIPEIIRKLHGRVGHDINLLDGVSQRKVWHNYWDSCISNEKDWWKHFNYIHQNPIKHGYVREMIDWTYSSYSYYLRAKGEEWLMDAFLRYPIIDFHNDKDNY